MRLTYSNVVSSIALVAAVGGGATAGAAALSRNSVGTAQIRDRSVHVRDLATTARPQSRARIAALVTDTMTSSDVLSALSEAVKGQSGAPGPQGAQGPQGPAGAPGVAGVVVRQAATPVVGPSTQSATARCEAGETAIGGGGGTDNDAGVLSRSAPLEDGAGWYIVATNQSTVASSVRAFAVCAKVGA